MSKCLWFLEYHLSNWPCLLQCNLNDILELPDDFRRISINYIIHIFTLKVKIGNTVKHCSILYLRDYYFMLMTQKQILTFLLKVELSLYNKSSIKDSHLDFGFVNYLNFSEKEYPLGVMSEVDLVFLDWPLKWEFIHLLRVISLIKSPLWDCIPLSWIVTL